MRLKIWSGLLLFALVAGCGVRPEKERADRTAELIIGVWDALDGEPTKCNERLTINEDNTFWWFEAKRDFTGTYILNGEQITFLFTTKPSEIVQITVDEKFLGVFRSGIQTRYTKVPREYATKMPCPSDRPTTTTDTNCKDKSGSKCSSDCKGCNSCSGGSCGTCGGSCGSSCTTTTTCTSSCASSCTSSRNTNNKGSSDGISSWEDRPVEWGSDPTQQGPVGQVPQGPAGQCTTTPCPPTTTSPCPPPVATPCPPPTTCTSSPCPSTPCPPATTNNCCCCCCRCC